jgi:prepilin-type N-terminal cleavage/methylation domain-containing protein
MLRKKGFTLVEIMIVVAIIGLLAAIAIPNFVRARTTALKNACIANLKQLQGAAQVYALDHPEMNSADSVDNGDLVSDYIKVWPRCGNNPYESFSPDVNPVCPSDDATHTLNS